jgi:hypothetical protein
VLLAAREEETGRSAVVAIKHNLTGSSAALEYRIGEDGFAWIGAAPELTPERLLAVPLDAEERTARQEAEDFLREQLADGPRRTKDVEAAAREQGISVRTLKRARKRLGVVADQRPTGKQGATEWWLSPGWEVVSWPGPLLE